MTTFPTWLTGPNGERRVFHKAEDVPEGWVDGLTARASLKVGDIVTGLPRGPAKIVAVVSADDVEGEVDDTGPAAEHIGMRRKPARHK